MRSGWRSGQRNSAPGCCTRLRKLQHPHIKEIRGRGLLLGIELLGPARPYCERLKDLGVLCKETHDHVIRLAPPLIIAQEDLAWLTAQMRAAFAG